MGVMALGTSVLVGTPANAVVTDGNIVVSVSGDERTSTLSGSDLTLTAINNPRMAGIADDTEVFYWVIENPDEVAIVFDDTDDLNYSTAADDNFADGAAADEDADVGTVTISASEILVESAATVIGGAAVGAGTADLTLTAAAGTVTVYSFVEAPAVAFDDNRTFFFASTDTELTFIDAADSDLGITINELTLGSTAIDLEVTSSVLNLDSIQPDLSFDILLGGASAVDNTGAALTVNVDGELVDNRDLAGAATAGVYRATLFDAAAAGVGGGTDVIARSASYRVTAGPSDAPTGGLFTYGDSTSNVSVQTAVDTATIAAAVEANDAANEALAVAANRFNDGAANVRGGVSDEISVTFSVREYAFDGVDATYDAVAVSNVPVEVTLTPAFVADSGTTITAHGESITEGGTATDITFTVLSDADGNATITFASSTGEDTETVTLTANVITDTGSDDAENEYVFTYADTAAADVVLTNVAADGVANQVVGAVDGDVTLNFAVLDNYNELLTDAGYQLVFPAAQSDFDVVDGEIIPVTNGLATLTFTEDTGVEGTYSVRADLYEGVTAAGVNQTVSIILDSAGAASSFINVAATETTANADDLPSLETEDLVAFDERLSAVTNPYTATERYTLVGTVVDADSVVVPGALITFSATGNVAFVVSDGADEVGGVGSLTVQADADGAFDVDVYSQVAGEVVVTMTAGDASDSATIEFAAAVLSQDGSLSLSGVSTLELGQATEITATLVDEYGNAIAEQDMTVQLGGFGTVSPSTVTTDADGVATFTYTSSERTEGTAEITVTASPAAGDDVVATHDIVVSAPVVVAIDSVMVSGAAEVVAGESATFTATITDEDGNALAGRTVTLSEAGVGEITVLTGVTDANGQVTTMLVTSSAGNSYITATAEGKSHTLLVKVVAPAPEPVEEVVAPAEPVGKVNVGTFNGKVVVYALGLSESTVSWKIAGKWQKVEVTEDALQRYDRPTAAIGLDINVDIYVDGELRLSKTVTTK